MTAAESDATVTSIPPVELYGFLVGELPEHGRSDDAIKLTWSSDTAELSFENWRFGDLHFCLFEGTDSVDVAPLRKKRSWPGLTLGLCLEGQITLSQAGHDATLEPGRFAFYRAGLPFRLRATGRHRWLVVRLGLHRMGHLGQELANVLATENPPRASVSGMLVAVLREAAGHRRLSARSKLYCADAIHMLVRATVDEMIADYATPVTRSQFSQFTQWLEDRITEPGLDAVAVAAAHHVSASHVRKVFARHDVTVSAFVRQRRLEHLREDLLDPQLATISVTTLARRWAMHNPAATSRMFRAQYDSPPQAYRLANIHPYPS